MSVRYIYGVEGNRIAKLNRSGAVIASYIVGLGGEKVGEEDGAGKMVHQNVFAGGSLLGTYDENGLHYHLNDWLGTRRVQMSKNGVLDLSCFSLPFGDGLQCSGSATDATEHHFTGKERDDESKNDYFEARYYSSAMGWFMSPDWSTKEDPVPYADLDDPQSLNLYSYVRNNPLVRTDSDGHCPWCALVGAAVGVGAEIVADKLSGKPVTVRGVIGAAVGGAIIGGSAGLASDEGIAIQAAIAVHLQLSEVLQKGLYRQAALIRLPRTPERS